MGELLSKDIGKSYFAIGTDAEKTKFNSQDSNGTFSIMEVKNRNMLNNLIDSKESDFYYIDFLRAADDENWQKILNRQQKIIALNVGISSWQKLLKAYYTVTIIPNDTYNGMIVFNKVYPITLIN